VCRTVKGKGVSFMENNADWHGKAPDEEQTACAVTELNCKL
jgi:transketolase